MAKRVRRVSDLPNWFSLKKYVDAERLDAFGWYKQLALRELLRGVVENVLCPRSKDSVMQPPGDPPEVIREHIREVLALVRENPIVNVDANPLLGALLNDVHSTPSLSTRIVRLTTIRDLYHTEANIKRDRRDQFRAYFTRLFNGETLGLRETPAAVDWIDKPIDCSTNSLSAEVILSVNLSAPDTLLVKRFEEMLRWLRAPPTRRELNTIATAVAQGQKPDFETWVRRGVLPYLDLQIWESEAAVKIPNRVMADAIFPPGEGGEEVVRKTTAKLAHELLSVQHLEALAAIAAHEIAEQTPACSFSE